mgnify:CR=1 FL=1
MAQRDELQGIVAAVVTPLNAKDEPDLERLQGHIRGLANEGCHGFLLLGTTGEGPSMGIHERRTILEAGLSAAEGMTVYVGTGCPSLRDTIDLTTQAFELGADVVVVLPPYYYKKVSDEGLFAFYRCLFDEAVPQGKWLMLYDIPQQSQIPLSADLLERLLHYAGGRLAGVKDSTGNLDHGRELCRRFPELRIFVGTDRLLLPALRFGAAGCITAAANLFAPLVVAVYRAHLAGEDGEPLQEVLTQLRELLDQYQPLAPMLKSLLAWRDGSADWHVRPPLLPLPEESQRRLIESLKALELLDVVQRR